MDQVEAVIRAAALEAIGRYGRSKAERIAAGALAAFRARGWDVFTAQELEQLEDSARIPGSAELLSYPGGEASQAPADELDEIVRQAAEKSRPPDRAQ